MRLRVRGDRPARRAIGRQWGGSAQSAIACYEAASGEPRWWQVDKFEAASWLLAAGGNPSLALQQFRSETLSPQCDLSSSQYEGVLSWLERWAQEAGVPV